MKGKVSLSWRICAFGNRHDHESLLQLRGRATCIGMACLIATLGGPPW
jgi:hypothetical protein